MELPSRTPRELRYRAYFRLMDASTVAIGIGAVDYFADAVFQSGLEAFVPAPWIYVIGLPVLFFNFLVPMVLVVARFMRDDYAEGLWRRAMLVVGYGVAIGPIVLLATSWLLYLAVGPVTPPWLRPVIDEQEPVIVMLVLWQAHLMLFVCAFQFMRWTDAR